MSLFKKEKKEPKEVTVKGKKMKCTVCANDRFLEERAMMNTTKNTFWGLDAIDKEGTCYVCSDCSYIMWFAPNYR